MKKNGKKMLGILLAFMMVVTLTACGQTSGDEESVELTVFAAASLQETLTEIGEMYEEEMPNVTITFNFDSSGTLKTQIEEGAECDVYLSAAQKQMNALDSSQTGDANPDGLDFVEQGTRVNILENKVTLVVPEGNPENITSFEDLKERLQEGDILLAMGNSDVPVGQYAEKILAYFDLDEDALAADGCITYGSNVKEVTTQVSEGSVDCGIVYCTDAYSAELTIVDTATADMCGQVIYPAAVINTSQNKEAAQAFLDYLQTDECMAVFEEVGFSPVE
jgi:molybdate transport system substrate-binding protein